MLATAEVSLRLTDEAVDSPAAAETHSRLTCRETAAVMASSSNCRAARVDGARLEHRLWLRFSMSISRWADEPQALHSRQRPARSR